MSATTGIPPGSLWGDKTSLPWSDRLARTRTTSVPKETAEPGTPDWLTKLGQFLLNAVFTLLSIPLIVIGAIVAAVVTAWALLLPALVVGLVVVVVSFIITAI